MPPAAIDFFVAGFSENAKYLEARNLVRGILASHADTADRVTNGMTERERDVKLRPLCLERNLQWFYGQLNYTAPEHK